MSTEERLGSGLSFGTSYSIMDRQDNTAGPWNSDSDLPDVPSHTIAPPGCILLLPGSLVAPFSLAPYPTLCFSKYQS